MPLDNTSAAQRTSNDIPKNFTGNCIAMI